MSDDLREILAARTPGRWRTDVRVGVVQVYSGEERNCLAAPSGRVVMSRQGAWTDDHWVMDEQDIADARAIVAAVNTIDAALAVVRAARAVRVIREDDWACRECLPGSDALVEGFRCRPHTLRAALAAFDEVKP